METYKNLSDFTSRLVGWGLNGGGDEDHIPAGNFITLVVRELFSNESFECRVISETGGQVVEVDVDNYALVLDGPHKKGFTREHYLELRKFICELGVDLDGVQYFTDVRVNVLDAYRFKE